MFSATKTIVAIAALAAAVSLFAPTAAQAGGFSIGFSGGEDGVTASSGFAFGGGIDEDGLPRHFNDESYYTDNFKKLDQEDDQIHLNMVLKGHTFGRQVAHDCLAVKKIKLLILQMEDTKIGYIRIGDAVGLKSQQQDINRWTQRLVEAEEDCAKGII